METMVTKAIIALLGQGEESWALVQQDLIRELQTWNFQYVELFDTQDRLVKF